MQVILVPCKGAALHGLQDIKLLDLLCVNCCTIDELAGSKINAQQSKTESNANTSLKLICQNKSQLPSKSQQKSRRG